MQQQPNVLRDSESDEHADRADYYRDALARVVREIERAEEAHWPASCVLQAKLVATEALRGDHHRNSYLARAERNDDAFFHWMAGLIDGEGCFSIDAAANGFKLRMRITLRADDCGALHEIQGRTRLGTLVQSFQGSETDNPQIMWTVARKAECRRLADILDTHPLRAKKARDYAAWREALEAWERTPGDWETMARLKASMETTRKYREPRGGWPILARRLAYIVCAACGTQFAEPTSVGTYRQRCRNCDPPGVKLIPLPEGIDHTGDHTAPALLDTSTSPTPAEEALTPVVTDVSEDGANRDRTGDLLLAKQHGPARSSQEIPAHGGYPGVAHFYPGDRETVQAPAIGPGIDHTDALWADPDVVAAGARELSEWFGLSWLKPVTTTAVLRAALTALDRAALIEKAAAALASQYAPSTVLDSERRVAEQVLVAVGLIPATRPEDA